MKRRIFFAALALALLLAGCGAQEMTMPMDTPVEVVKLTAEEAYEMMNGEESVLVLDVRTAAEYADGHIPGALLLPNEDIGEARPELLPDTDAAILIYCRSGNRSAQAAGKLLALGYTRVYDFGGIRDWPYEVEQ